MSSCSETGITTFDHSDIYGGYTTEAAFGPADKTRITNLMKAKKVGMELEDWFAFWTEIKGSPVP